MKQYYFYLRFAWLVLLFLTGAMTAMGNSWYGTMTEAGIQYTVYITGYGDDAVADSAWVVGHDDNLGSTANIPSSVSYEYTYTKFVGYDEQHKPIYVTVTRYLSCPVKRINSSVFAGKTELTSVNIGSSVTYIGGSAFSGCTNLTSVNIPSSVTYIGDKAFLGCASLTSVNIPSSVTKITNDCFNGCTSLTGVTIPNSVTTIGGSAFSGCTSLAGVTIGNSVTTIGGSAFSGCTNLTSVNIPSSVTIIPYGCFSGCASLTSVNIPNSVTAIGKYAFKDCTNLASVTIGESVTTISDYTFYGCHNLKNLVWKARNAQYFTLITEQTEEYYDFICVTTTTCSIENVFIDNGVEVIPHGFLMFSKITEVNIPNSVTTIYSGAFNNCSKLTSVTIPNSVVNLSGFNYCDSLTSVTIPNSVTTITDAFNYSDMKPCQSMNDITIGKSVDSISNCFRYISHLNKLTWNAINCNKIYNVSYGFRPDSLIIGDEVEVIPSDLISKASGLTSVIIPNSVTTIGDCAFSDLTLKELSIGNSVTKAVYPFDNVYTSSFYWNAKDFSLQDEEHDLLLYGLECQQLVIGPDVESIGDYVFWDLLFDDYGEQSVTSLAITPPAITYNCFYDWAYGLVLYVPKESLQAYREAEGWKEFYRIEPIETVLPGDVSGDGIIDIADVVAMIDYILGKDPQQFDPTVADMNGDGNIDIADVVALIDRILNGA